MIEKIVANGHGPLRDPKYLAIHSTANPGASAANHVNYWRNNPTYAVHAVSDWKEAYHTVPYDRLCYQVGNGNSTCIGIEICEATNEADFMRGMEVARTAIWEMLNMNGWVVDRLRSHLWFTQNYGGSDHTDPIPYLKRFGKDWDWFVDFIENGTKNEPNHYPTNFPQGATMFRLMNQYTGKHLFTENEAERDYLVDNGWIDEGAVWEGSIESPIFRLYNSAIDDRMLTTSEEERYALMAAGYTFEGIAGYSRGDVPIFRIYNSITQEHLWTANEDERDLLVASGWNDEGVGFYAVDV